MNPGIRTLRNEQGVALLLALFALVMLAGLVLTFLAMAGMEPLIAQNHDTSARALHIAAGGVELASSQLASSFWQQAFNNLTVAGLIKEYSTAINTADADVVWSTTPPSPLRNATRIRWRGLTLGSGTYTVMGASVNANGAPLSAGQVRVLSIGYVPNSTAPQATRTIEVLARDWPANFLKYGFSSTGAVFSDEINFASQSGGFNDSYNGGPGVFQPTLSTGFYATGNVPTGGAWSSTVALSPSTYPTIDFARYASSPTVVNLNALRDANGVVSLTSPSQVANNTAYYVDGSFFLGNIGNTPTATFIATHDIKNNATHGMTAVSGYPLLLTGGYIYMDTDNTNPLQGAIYSDGSHALAANRTYPINPLWVGHSSSNPPGDLVYVESHSQIIGTVAARIPSGSGLRLFGGGGSTVTYDMNLLNGLANLYVQNGAAGGSKYLAWREK